MRTGLVGCGARETEAEQPNSPERAGTETFEVEQHYKPDRPPISLPQANKPSMRRHVLPVVELRRDTDRHPCGLRSALSFRMNEATAEGNRGKAGTHGIKTKTKHRDSKESKKRAKRTAKA